MSYFTLASTGDRPGVPVVAENVGPYESLAAALADWPGFHEASGDEYATYADYWNTQPDKLTRTRTGDRT